MENITFTVSGTFSVEATEKYADFLGYTEMIPTPEPYPNPLTRVQFVQEHIKELFSIELSKMRLNEAKAEAEKTYQETISEAEENVKEGLKSLVIVQIS